MPDLDPSFLGYLRLGSFIIWAAAAVILAPSVWRYVTSDPEPCLEYRTALFFVSLLFVGSLGRWLLAPSDHQVLLGLTAMTAALAVYVLILAAQGRRR